MDQSPLVTEQIDAGKRVILELDKYAPLQAAFWIKDGEEGHWVLYLVSDRINHSNFAVAYGAIHRITVKQPSLWFDPTMVRIVGVDNPIAKDVMDIQQKYPDILPMRLRTCRLGGVYVAEAFLYALPIVTSTP